MSDDQDYESDASSDGENANVPQEQQLEDQPDMRYPPPMQQVAQQQQHVYSPNIPLQQPIMMQQHQGTTFFYQAPLPHFVQQGYNPNVQQGNVPNLQGNVPNVQGFVPQVQQGFVPQVQQGFVPQVQQGFVPQVQQGFVPQVQQGFVPQVQQGFVPQVQQGFVPQVQQGFVPQVQQGFVPQVHQGFVPQVQQGFVPNEQFHGPQQQAQQAPQVNSQFVEQEFGQQSVRTSYPQQRAGNVGFRPYNRTPFSRQRRGSFRGRSRAQLSTRGRGTATGTIGERPPEVIYKLIPTSKIVLNGPVVIQKACFHRTMPRRGKSSSIDISNPIDMIPQVDERRILQMTNQTVINGPAYIEQATFCTDEHAPKRIHVGDVSGLNNEEVSSPTRGRTFVFHMPTAQPGQSVRDFSGQGQRSREQSDEQERSPDSSEVSSASSQADTVRDLHQQLVIHSPIEKVVQEKTPAQMTFGETVAARLQEWMRASGQTNTVQESHQQQGVKSPVKEIVEEEAPAQMTFAKIVASKLEDPVIARPSAQQQNPQGTAVKLHKDDKKTQNVEKVAPKSISKPEKPRVRKTREPSQSTTIPSHWQAVIAQEWTQVGPASSSNQQGPSCSTAPVTIDPLWLTIPTDEQLLGFNSQERADSSKSIDIKGDQIETIKVHDSDAVPSEDKSSHEKNDENGERPPRMSAAQKKAQERAELNADLATVCAKDRLTESCQSYIEAHQEVRQYLLDSGSMCLDLIETDKFQHTLLESFMTMPGKYWTDSDVANGLACIKELKGLHGLDTLKDKNLRLKYDVLLENKCHIIVQDVLSIINRCKEKSINLAEELEHKYFEALFNPNRGRPRIIPLEEKISPVIRESLEVPDLSVDVLSGLIKRYMMRQVVIRSLGNQGKINFESSLEKELHEKYLENKSTFEQHLERREDAIMNFRQFWRYQQKVLFKMLPKEDMAASLTLWFSELLLSVPFNEPRMDVLLFDAMALQTMYVDYYSISKADDVTVHTRRYLWLILKERMTDTINRHRQRREAQ